MAVTDLAAAVGAVVTAGVEAAVVAGAAGLAIATTEIGVLPQPPRAQRYVANSHDQVTETDLQHLYEIFGQFGRIKDLDLPMNRTFGTNRGTAYILYDYEDDAEAAIAHMHEAQVDGSAINVSIVLPRRKLSPAPPTARRGANIDPRVPFAGTRGGPPGAGMGGNNGMGGGGGGRRRASPGSRYGPRSDVYRPGSRSPSRSSAGPPPSRGGGGSRYRSRSNNSFSSRSRSRSPGPRRKAAGRHDDHETRRRGSIDSREGRSRSRSRGRGPK
ncbi:hypothetical protein FOXB_11771 [Fusarium oxysporum f. sp. conglutinans Fo5176]|uniref:RRM domain-containing protein n=1 Tax=Fusarium oxysporum (strain Fo5176) TaxID=660025 RepID=F9FZD9_FUSOF|nr:hypothetical protein FOXB_11771 [Fusarium oxysporum f. sp. conglutinans Fo5176]